MKKAVLYSIILGILFLSCNTEELENSSSSDPNFRVSEAIIENVDPNISNEEYCVVTNLIAGQHHIAGSVTVESDGVNLIITYTTNEGWTINATHLSIGGCDDESIPTNGAGNPTIGRFEYHSTHSDGVNQVTYMISLDVIPEYYCFAAHAEVSGPTGGETAWAEGSEFSGNSWAMYVEAVLSDCNIIMPE